MTRSPCRVIRDASGQRGRHNSDWTQFLFGARSFVPFLYSPLFFFSIPLLNLFSFAVCFTLALSVSDKHTHIHTLSTVRLYLFFPLLVPSCPSAGVSPCQPFPAPGFFLLKISFSWCCPFTLGFCEAPKNKLDCRGAFGKNLLPH